MKRLRSLGLIVGLLLVCGVAHGQQVATVQNVMDYVDNSWVTGIWFATPTEVLDHSPYYRTSNEDWGWVHNLIGSVPADALGIESATLTIIAWNVDPNTVEVDHVIYMLPDRPPEGTKINGQDSAKHIFQLGVLNSYVDAPITVQWPSVPGQRMLWQTLWSVTSFELPAPVLGDLWVHGQAYVHINIDQYMPAGWRVTLKSSVLTVRYLVSGAVTPATVPVFRFWSPVFHGHFYTMKETERDKLINNYPSVWTYEDVAYRVLMDQTNPNAVPVYRFWSPALNGHFYTADETERDRLISEFPDVWTYEGEVFYAFPEGLQPADTYPVYHFWSDSLSHHFYTIKESEKQKLIDNYSQTWTYKGIAWYAYLPGEP